MTQPAAGLPQPPPVRGGGVAHVLIPGTIIWLIAFIALWIALPSLRERGATDWFWVALAGWLLGLVGLSIYAWQRAAARRGSRGASQGALDEQLRP